MLNYKLNLTSLLRLLKCKYFSKKEENSQYNSDHISGTSSNKKSSFLYRMPGVLWCFLFINQPSTSNTKIQFKYAATRTYPEDCESSFGTLYDVVLLSV